MIQLMPHPEGTIVPVHAQPGAKRNALVGTHGLALKVSVTAAPERGRANEAVGEVLAGALEVRPSAVELLSGQTSRQKRFLVRGLSPDEVRVRLDRTDHA